jgi:hypothetical protein
MPPYNNNTDEDDPQTKIMRMLAGLGNQGDVGDNVEKMLSSGLVSPRAFQQFQNNQRIIEQKEKNFTTNERGQTVRRGSTADPQYQIDQKLKADASQARMAAESEAGKAQAAQRGTDLVALREKQAAADNETRAARVAQNPQAAIIAGLTQYKQSGGGADQVMDAVGKLSKTGDAPKVSGVKGEAGFTEVTRQTAFGPVTTKIFNNADEVAKFDFEKGAAEAARTANIQAPNTTSAAPALNLETPGAVVAQQLSSPQDYSAGIDFSKPFEPGVATTAATETPQRTGRGNRPTDNPVADLLSQAGSEFNRQIFAPLGSIGQAVVDAAEGAGVAAADQVISTIPTTRTPRRGTNPESEEEKRRRRIAGELNRAVNETGLASLRSNQSRP